MGMFDNIKCAMVPDSDYQTKDTPSQFLDQYEIRADGSLWLEVYDVEDHSDPNATGLRKFAGCMARVNKRWEPLVFTGSIEFYDDSETYIAFIVDGHAIQIRQITDGLSREIWRKP